MNNISRLTDSETQIVSFKGNEISPNKKDTTEVGVSTSPIITSEKSINCTEFKDAEIQTSVHESDRTVTNSKHYDEGALLDFLRKSVPSIELELRKKNKHFGATFQNHLVDDDDEIITKQIATLAYHSDITDKMSCLNIVWSAYGNKIALCYGFKEHDTWCNHISRIIIYETDRNDEFTDDAKYSLEVNTCVVSIQFHPTLNSVLVYATEDGNIYWYFINDDSECIPKNRMQHKGGKITQMSWIDFECCLYLVVGDSDGYMYFWTTNANIKEWSLRKKIELKSNKSIGNCGVSCFDFSSLNNQNLVVALEGGCLLHCNVDLILDSGAVSSSPVVRDFECSCHFITSVRFSKFEENLFAVMSCDENLLLYSLKEKTPIFVIVTDYIPWGIEWSHLQENIIMSWWNDDKIYFYDYRNCVLIKTLCLENPIAAIDFKVKGMKLLIAATDPNNNTTIWQNSLFIR